LTFFIFGGICITMIKGENVAKEGRFVKIGGCFSIKEMAKITIGGIPIGGCLSAEVEF